MVDELMAGSPGRVLDVGCGTGMAGRLFLERGCEVIGVEPDERMAAVARRHGMAVEVGRFEQWNSRSRRFDLLICGQAWHWVDPTMGPSRASEVTMAGGRVALFWNYGRPEGDVRDALRKVYQRLAPDVDNYSVLLGNAAGDRIRETVATLADTGLFGNVEVRTYPWRQQYSTQEWLDHLMTHSDHRTLDRETRSALLQGVGNAIDAGGATMAVRYECSVVLAERRGHGGHAQEPS